MRLTLGQILLVFKAAVSNNNAMHRLKYDIVGPTLSNFTMRRTRCAEQDAQTRGVQIQSKSDPIGFVWTSEQKY